MTGVFNDLVGQERCGGCPGSACRRRGQRGVFGELTGQEPVVAELRQAAAVAADVLSGRGGRQPAAMTHAWLFDRAAGLRPRRWRRARSPPRCCARSGGCGGVRRAATRYAPAPTPTCMLVRPEGLSYGVKQTRDLVLRAAGSPAGGRWHVVLFEDADRCHRGGRQRPAQGHRGARAADGVAAVRAVGGGPGAHDQVPLPAGRRCGAVVGMRWPTCCPAGRHRPAPGAGRGPGRAGAHRPGAAAGHRRRPRPSAARRCCASRSP